MSQSKKKIVYVINNLVFGGAQNQLVNQLKYFDKQKYEFHLVTLATYVGKDTLYDRLPADVIVHTLNFKGFKNIKGWLSLYRCLKKISPDLVISSLFFSNTVVRILKLLLQYPVITREHNTYANKSWYHQWVDKFLAPISATIVAVSQEVADFTAKQEGIPVTKFTVINNGIDIEAVQKKQQQVDKMSVKNTLGLNDSDKVVLYVGRLIQQKKLDVMIRGFAIFTKENADWKLLIVGGGGLEGDLRKLIEAEGVARNIMLLGEQDNVHQYYAIGNCLLSTSVMEGMSNVHLEALAHGLPILSTRTGGTSSIIEEGINGFIIPKIEPEAVTDTLKHFTKVNQKAMSEASIKISSDFSIQEVVKRYEILFERYTN